MNWDPTQPLRWNDLIEIGHVGNRPAEDFTTIRSFIPDSYIGRRAALVSIWQRDYTHSHEAFYAVSDIFVAGDTGCGEGDPVDVTFANNTDCTLQYYQNSALRGSANAGGSYAVNTNVGTQWEARKTSGEQVSSFNISCGQSTYSSTGTCEQGGCTTGDVREVTFTNNTDCTLQYYQNNALQGTAAAGGSYRSSTTVGSQWEARKTSGELMDGFTIACEQNIYTSNGSCGNGSGNCATPYGPYPNYYMKGDMVSHEGRNYEALSDNLYNVTPGTAAHGHWWGDLGPCTANVRARAQNRQQLAGELNFIAFPNPAHEVINLKIHNARSSSFTITVTAIDGRILETLRFDIPEGSGNVDRNIRLSKLSPGIYFVNVTSGKKTMIKKVIIK